MPACFLASQVADSWRVVQGVYIIRLPTRPSSQGFLSCCHHFPLLTAVHWAHS
jgi:hypothetical protein